MFLELTDFYLNVYSRIWDDSTFNFLYSGVSNI